jgi:hypothetical protein
MSKLMILWMLNIIPIVLSIEWSLYINFSISDPLVQGLSCNSSNRVIACANISEAIPALVAINRVSIHDSVAVILAPGIYLTCMDIRLRTSSIYNIDFISLQKNATELSCTSFTAPLIKITLALNNPYRIRFVNLSMNARMNVSLGHLQDPHIININENNRYPNRSFHFENCFVSGVGNKVRIGGIWTFFSLRLVCLRFRDRQISIGT